MDEQTKFYYTKYQHEVNSLKAEGINTGWTPIVASQMMMEASWGKSPLAKLNNFFGMKAAKGQKGEVFNTKEGNGKNAVRINDKLDKYPLR